MYIKCFISTNQYSLSIDRIIYTCDQVKLYKRYGLVTWMNEWIDGWTKRQTN